MRLEKRRQKFTTKFCDNISEAGEYLDYNGPVPGLILVVGPDTSKSWILRYRNRGKRREMGLGSYSEVRLAAAREKGREARLLLAHGIDPIEHRKEQRHQRWLADAVNLDFLAVAEKFFSMKTRGDNPWWGKAVARKNRNILDNHLTPLHHMPINSAAAADAITLRLYQDIVGPKWLTRPTMALHIKHIAYGICDHAHALKVLPMTVANPAGKPLDVLLGERQPDGGHWPAIPYHKVPALYAKVDALSQPACSHFTLTEAARAVGISKSIIKHAIRAGKLPAIKGETTLLALKISGMIPYEWRIDPADLFKVFPKVLDLTPGVQPVIFELIKFCILNGPRPSEAREMKWTEYDETERLWIIPWQRTKAGKDIGQDMIIPLSEPANNIIMMMKEQQRCYGIKTDYVFANYPSRFNTNAHIGQPPSHVTLLENLRKALPPEEIKATMHGMRTAMRSWGDEQRRPDGSPWFSEKDLERAIGHIAGFGETLVSRNYSRQSSALLGLIPIFDRWGEFVTSGGLPADVIPIRRRQVKQAAGG
jgi:integrase